MKTKRWNSKPIRATRPSRPVVKSQTKTVAKRSLYIVGLGASAGGLEALEDFFHHLPADSGVGFVLVAHLDPTHKPLLTELLQRSTEMKVVEINDGTKVRRNCIYVIPPNKDLSIEHGVLRLKMVASPRGLRMPIDFFLRRLAEDQHSRAIGIILSGMGMDGSLGLRAIKDKLGLVMVQEPASAKYDGMPRSALETGLVDFVAPPDQLAAKLIKYVKHTGRLPREPLPLADSSMTALQKIFALLREQTGHDFSFYKKNTIYRRIERRMAVHNHRRILEYVRYLHENPQETKLLFKELLIGVTSFFRDPEAWDLLKEKALPQLLKSMVRRNTLRVWIPGCSSGEEAYSVAIVLRECLAKRKPKAGFKIQVFATDIDATAIDAGRQGFFTENIAADVSPERLQQFFTKEENGYRIKKEIREMILFAPQNIIMDPPFTKLDLLCCRNLLIYFTPELQKKLLPLFHYTLNPGGILMLGPSETLGMFADCFNVVDNQWKIFARRESPVALQAMVGPSSLLRTRNDTEARKTNPSPRELAGALPDLAQQIILDHYAPAAVLVNAQGDIIYVSGRTGKFLEPSPGNASMNLMAMAREGLRMELGVALRKALSKKNEVRLRGVKVRSNGGATFIDLAIRPLIEPESLRGLCLVVFQEVESQPKLVAPGRGTKSADVRYRVHLGELAGELKQAREQLQTTIEEMETSQEELKSANEEMQSTNEELQSTNEEVTTSKEEMQSLNEELVTVNTELQIKVDELSQTGNDMRNLLNSTEIATIFLDNDLNIKRYTPQATRIVNLIPGDVGRPLEHIVANLKYDSLVKDVREVVRSLVFKEVEVEKTDGHWHRMRIMPYRTVDNLIDGAVITFIDITAFKHMETSLRQTERRLRLVLERLPVMVAAMDDRGTIVFWNGACERSTGWKTEEVVGNPAAIKLLDPDETYRAQLTMETGRRDESSRSFAVNLTCKNRSVKTFVWCTVSRECPIPGWASWGIAWEANPGSDGDG